MPLQIERNGGFERFSVGGYGGHSFWWKGKLHFVSFPRIPCISLFQCACLVAEKMSEMEKQNLDFGIEKMIFELNSFSIMHS